MKNKLTIITVLFILLIIPTTALPFSLHSVSVDSLSAISIDILRQPYSQWCLTGGYQFNTEEHSKNNHILEIGITKVIPISRI